MASGKTTLGRALAKSLNIPFYDLDFFIEQRFRASVAELFASHGEEWFRKVESNILKEIGEFNDVVISCGGGTPCFFDNMDYMNSQGTTVWVDASIPCIVRRLLVAKVKRPLAQGKSAHDLTLFVADHLSQRLSFYSAAKVRFPGDNLENRTQIAQSVQNLIPLLQIL